MNDPIHFHLVVDLAVIARDDIDTVAGALAKMRGICLAEPGCLRWEAMQATESPEKFFLVETWETRDHWEAHGELSAIRDIYIPVVLPRIQRLVFPTTPKPDSTRPRQLPVANWFL